MAAAFEHLGVFSDLVEHIRTIESEKTPWPPSN
jgi:hypothetical protein